MFGPTAVFLKWGPPLGPLIPKFWASLYPCLSSDLFCRVFQPGNLLEFSTSFSCRCWNLWRFCLGRLHGRLSIIQRLVDFAFLNFHLSSSLKGNLTTHLVLYAGCLELLWMGCPLSLFSGFSRRGTSTLNLVWHLNWCAMLISLVVFGTCHLTPSVMWHSLLVRVIHSLLGIRSCKVFTS